MIGVMVSTGKLTYVSLNFHNSVLASYNILSLSSLANQTYFTGQVLRSLSKNRFFTSFSWQSPLSYVITSCHIWYVVYLVKLTFRDEVSSLIIYISSDIGLFSVSSVTNCGKFRYRIDIISKSYSYLKSAISLWVKHTHLVALQLSNTGLSIGFITSNKLINQSLHFWFLDRARKIRKLHWQDDYKWVALNICGGNDLWTDV